MSLNNKNNNKQQQQQQNIYSHSSSYSSTSEISLEDLLQPLGESAIPIEEDEASTSGSNELILEDIKQEEIGLALSTMLETLNSYRSSKIAVPESFSPYSSPPPPIFNYNYSSTENKGKAVDHMYDSTNLYFQPRYFGSGSSSGSSTPGSIMSYTSTSSGTTSPGPTLNPIDYQRNQRNYPSSSPPPVPTFLTSSFMTKTKSQQAREVVGLVGNFGGISPTGGKISSSSRGRELVESEEIEGVSLRVKSRERDGFAF